MKKIYACNIPCKFVKKICFIILITVLFVSFVSWLSSDTNEIEQNESVGGWIRLRLDKNQEEYVDNRGVHVVVGHYVGDENVKGLPPNLSDEILNNNNFDPKPNEGKNGQAVIIPSFLSNRMKQLFHINRFNLMASDRIPLDRKLPDVRKKKCQKKNYLIDEEYSVSVIIVFHNEAWSTLLRTATSVINRSPGRLLKEIIFVDDASTRTFLKKPLDDYLSKLPIYSYVIHNSQRSGLIRSRLIGAREAKGKILLFLDAHCECTEGWLEPLVHHVAMNRTQVACPVIDIISDETFAYIRSFEWHLGAFNWDLHFRWYTIGDLRNHRLLMKNTTEYSNPFKTPVMAGGLFAIDREYFFEIGSYDDQMEIWGGENLEMSFRIWQCGGSVDIVPCSHVGHIFRKSSPYIFPGGVSEILYSNLARVALVWMDEWGEFYFKFHSDANRIRDQLPVRNRIELRSKLKCHNFKWYLENVWPQNFLPMEGRFFGKIRHLFTNTCLEKPSGNTFRNQPSGLASVSKCSTRSSDLSQMFVMIYDRNSSHIGTIGTDESVCLDISRQASKEIKPKVHILSCSGTREQKWIYNDQDMTLIHVQTNLCAEVGKNELSVVLSECSTDSYQKWVFENVPWM